MPLHRLRLIIVTAAAAATAFAQKLPPAATLQVNYEQHVEPILAAKCFGCHGSAKQLAGLRLDRRQNALRGGDYGKVIVPGDSANSKLIHRIAGPEAGLQMPPAGPLEPDEIAILRAWIDQGPSYGDSQRRVPGAGTPRRATSPELASLIDAVVAGDQPAIDRVIAQHPEAVRESDSGGSTALLHAAGRGSLASVDRLLASQAAYGHANARGATPLIWALGDAAKVRALLAAGADPNAKTREGRTALHVAAGQPALVDVAKMLLDKGADVKALDVAGLTPLHLAATAGSAPMVSLLLAAGAPVNARAANGATPLIAAAMSGSNAAVRALLAAGADAKAVTKRNVSALGPAAYWGHVETMRMLLAKGAPVNLHEADGYSPLMYAAYSEVAPIAAVRLLLDKGADPESGGGGETPASLAAMRGAADVIQLLEQNRKGTNR